MHHKETEGSPLIYHSRVSADKNTDLNNVHIRRLHVIEYISVYSTLATWKLH